MTELKAIQIPAERSFKPCAWNTRADEWFLVLGLYTDESPGLKVDPVVVLVLSLGFIFSVVALHSMYTPIVVFVAGEGLSLDRNCANAPITVIAKLTRKFSS